MSRHLYKIYGFAAERSGFSGFTEAGGRVGRSWDSGRDAGCRLDRHCPLAGRTNMPLYKHRAVSSNLIACMSFGRAYAQRPRRLAP